MLPLRSGCRRGIASGLIGATMLWWHSAAALPAETPVTLENLEAPTANAADEALLETFSLEKATHFLDSAALHWQKSRDCMTCHTNYLYLMARPTVSAAAPAHATVRTYLENLVTQRWVDKGPRWDAEVLMSALVLAHNDSATTGKLHATSRQALDRMWTVQREDGGFSWLKCDWPPMESDDYYGATVAALACGVAPDDYQQTPAAQAGLAKLRQYLQNNAAPSLHHRLMLLWAAQRVPDLLTPAQQAELLAQVSQLQHADGGWSLAALGDWKREDGSPQDPQTSDGYGTGFVVFVLRQAGVSAQDERLQRGVAWLKSHQRASGRWYTRSLHKDNKHFITHAGTAFAVMAIQACEATPVAAR